MAQFTIDLPDELIAFAKTKLGYDVDSLIQDWLIKPLMERYEIEQKNVELAKVEPAITAIVEGVRSKVKLEKVKKQLDNKPVNG